jgi:pimeloyl-ACP methyl ester carboxylesterase
MTGVGERSHLLRPDIDLDFHIRDILAVLHYDDLRDVVLVGHSYGGMVITGVADRAPDRVGHLVYLDAAMPAGGEALADIAAPLMDLARRDMHVIDGTELVLFPGTEPIPNYGVTDPESVSWMQARLTPHPWKCFTQPLELSNEAALWAIPQSVICCTSTLAFRDPTRLEPARSAGRLWDIDTGHDLMISEPDAVAELLLRVPAA